ncbi:MAG TPA: purine-nucleoside phosphorylase [Lachnospiraceae bacterium]|nr:purine-nucleoside phosphorylase [Lachnospiraceae bacterium]
MTDISSEISTELDKALEYIIANNGQASPEIGLILGSGLGELADQITDKTVIPYGDIPGFPTSSVEGHKGCFVFGKLEGVSVVCMQGRVHYYEGYSMQKVVMPVRLMCKMGISKLILTNAAGGIGDSLEPGSLMIITDQITSFVPSPLIGPNYDAGLRFPDMSSVYSPELVSVIKKAAEDCGIDIQTGVYLQTTGPNYETPAEIRMYKALGADAVGMSTAVEAMAAVHAGVKVAGISCITNKAAGLSTTPLSHEEVQSAANKVKSNFQNLLKVIIKTI